MAHVCMNESPQAQDMVDKYSLLQQCCGKSLMFNSSAVTLHMSLIAYMRHAYMRHALNDMWRATQEELNMSDVPCSALLSGIKTSSQIQAVAISLMFNSSGVTLHMSLRACLIYVFVRNMTR